MASSTPPSPLEKMSAGALDPPPPRLLDRVRAEIRVRHYSLRTEETYVDWIRRFILFHGKRHPSDLGAREVEGFLSFLASERHVAAATQNQAKAGRRLPVVLAPGEVRRLLDQMDGVSGLVARLLSGTGMRLLEGLRLRVKDLDFDRHEVIVRAGKGDKDRVTMLPASLGALFGTHLAKVKALHDRDLMEGFGEVLLPGALGEKFPSAGRAWGWQWVFPSVGRSFDPRSGVERRHHLHPETVQRAVRVAARNAELVKRTS